MKYLFIILALFICSSADAARNFATADVTLCVNTATGSDANTGISPSCKKTINAAAVSMYRDWDLSHYNAFIDVAPGVYDESVGVGGQLTGVNDLQIMSSAGGFAWTNNGTCLSLGDNAEVVIYANITFVCNKSNLVNQAAIYVHNNGILDLFGNNTFSGAGTNDTMILVDGPGILTVAGSSKIYGAFNNVVWGGRQMAATFSGAVTFNGTYLNQIFSMYSGSTMNLGANFNPAGLAHVVGSIVSGNSVLNANGISIPGGYATSNGGIVCNTYC